MSMRDNNHRLTICEVLRCANDCLQDGIVNENNFELVRDLLSLAEYQAKRMSQKLFNYNKQFDEGWWKEKKNVEKNLKRELETYKVGNKEKALEVLERWTR